MVRVYKEGLVGAVPRFPREMEDRIDAYLATPAAPEAAGPVADLEPAVRQRLPPITVERTLLAAVAPFADPQGSCPSPTSPGERASAGLPVEPIVVCSGPGPAPPLAASP